MKFAKVNCAFLTFCLFVCGLFVSHATAQRPELLYLRFNAGSGLVVVDQSVPGLPGTTMTMNNITWNSTTPILGGSSIVTRLATTSQPLCSTQAPVMYSGSWTMEVWLRKIDVLSGNDQGYIFGHPNQSTPSFGYPAAGNNRDDRLVLEGPGVNLVAMSGLANIIGWFHLALVYDDSDKTLTMYIDGVPKRSVSQPNGVPLNSAMTGLMVGGTGQDNWLGTIDEFRLWNRSLSQAEITAGMMAQSNAFADDLAVTDIVSPVRPAETGGLFGATESVVVRIANLGSNVVTAGTSIPISYSTSTGTVVNENFTLPANLAQGESTLATFSATLDLSGFGTKDLTASVAHTPDQNALNDSKTRIYGGQEGHYVTEYPSIESFDSAEFTGVIPPGFWAQDQTDGADDWSFVDVNDPLTSNASTPLDDHTLFQTQREFFACVPTALSSSNVNLLSPFYELAAGQSHEFDFRLYSFNASMTAEPDNMLHVDIIDAAGAITPDVISPLGSQSVADWVGVSVDLTPFAGQAVRIRFRADTSLNLTSHDIAIDDLRVNSMAGGQDPQVGVATLDMNASLSGGGYPLSYGDQGPYFATATAGGPLDIRVEGESSQPIIVVFGALNVGAATFPSAGQMDIGGIPDPVSGIPQGIAVLFDGSNPTGLNPLFVTNGLGILDVFFTVPSIPPGILTTFQAAVFNSTVSGLVLSNAVQLEIL